MAPGDGTKVVRLGSEWLYPLSYPVPFTFKTWNVCVMGSTFRQKSRTKQQNVTLPSVLRRSAFDWLIIRINNRVARWLNG